MSISVQGSFWKRLQHPFSSLDSQEFRQTLLFRVCLYQLPVEKSYQSPSAKGCSKRPWRRSRESAAADFAPARQSNNERPQIIERFPLLLRLRPTSPIILPAINSAKTRLAE